MVLVPSSVHNNFQLLITLTILKVKELVLTIISAIIVP